MWKRLAPTPSRLTRPYWDGCSVGELRIQRCSRCSVYIHHPEPCCIRCGSDDLRFEAVSGLGTVDAFTEVSRSFVPGYDEVVPYVIGWVGLVEQPALRILSTISGAGELRIGAPVRVAFEPAADFGAVPVFQLT
jgi:uncharacterized OB-fold protein